MAIEIVETDQAPRPVAPYSQAVKCGGLVFVSGQLGIDPATGKLVDGGFEEQAKRALKNVEAILKAAGLGPRDIVKVNVYLKNPEDFKTFNRLYEEFLAGHRPSRTTVIASPPLEGALIEIEVVAYKGQ